MLKKKTSKKQEFSFENMQETKINKKEIIPWRSKGSLMNLHPNGVQLKVLVDNKKIEALTSSANCPQFAVPDVACRYAFAKASAHRAGRVRHSFNDGGKARISVDGSSFHGTFVPAFAQGLLLRMKLRRTGRRTSADAGT